MTECTFSKIKTKEADIFMISGGVSDRLYRDFFKRGYRNPGTIRIPENMYKFYSFFRRYFQAA